MKKTMVAYFSASGITKRVADELARGIAADIFAITPEEAYTSEDLDWQNANSRSSLEMQDAHSRVRIAKEIDNFEQYTIIFVGFPIWWYREPTIIDTFLASYDFAGKTIVPFATSGGSGMKECMQRIKQMVPQSIVKEGRLFSIRTDVKELLSWASQYL